MSPLRELYIRHRWEEFAPLPLPDVQKIALLTQQFAIQHLQYKTNYLRPSFMVLTGANGIAGRLYLNEAEEDIRIIDILLDGPLRGQGVGGALLRALIEAAEEQRSLSLEVDKRNPAQSLYRRLGFAETADLNHAWQMRRSRRVT